MSLAKSIAIGLGAYLGAGVVANLLGERSRDQGASPALPGAAPRPSLVTPSRVALWPLYVLVSPTGGGLK